MKKLQNKQIEKLKTAGSELRNEGEAYDPYQDFFRYTDLNKETNLREGITFNKDDGTFYAMLDIQSDWGENEREYGSSETFERETVKTLPQALACLKKAKTEFQSEIEAATKTIYPVFQKSVAV